MKTVAIDIGGTSIKGAIIQNNNILFKTKVPTNAKGGITAVKAAIFSILDTLTKSLTDYNIGVSSAGDINPYEGNVIFATDSLPDYTGLRLKDIIASHYGKDVAILNDAMCATLAEHQLGGGCGKKNIVMLTLGTGVGGGVIVDDKLLLGANYRASRLGHIILHPNGRSCTCGSCGCVEQYISATGFLQTAKEHGIIASDSNDVFKHDSLAVENTLKQFVLDLTLSITSLVATFDPEIILIGGGLTYTSQYWLKSLQMNISTPIALAKFMNDAGVLGANLYVNDNLKSTFLPKR